MRGGRRWVWGALAGVALVVVLLMLGLNAVADLQWNWAQHGTVSLGRLTLQLPFGWRRAEPGDGSDDGALALQRGHWNWRWGRSVDEISLREVKRGFDPVDLAQQWDRAETRSMVPGERLEPTPAKPYLREHYRCSDAKRSEDGTISFGCFERDGRWAVWYRGRSGGVRDLVAILASATDAGALR